ncbi:phosphatidate cytidylyltransferase [Pseudalkalibacillus caeni]|uniref:Phosphatidate cytidylyltransferase n=1 Tax=Exobacillus caeni TaxID=2574798 RepID=A0A5R9F949_9BACL|nr:phosphatidate cytidylyltransferase [Pseudalkalibacillus caeni]TLS37363.1 phosphatidate cytidylyltransferase [Pseudalkalibacillus caeni]
MKQRIITGVLAGALFIMMVILGGFWFSLLVTILATIGMYELLKMKQISIFSLPGLLGLIGTWVLVIPETWIETATSGIFSKIDLLFLGLLILLTMTVLTKNRYTFDESAFVLMSGLYVGLGFYYLSATRLLDNGLYLIFFIIFLIWATDSGAYFIGKAIGKHKLWPHISPNKTIEGAVGGIVSAIIVAVIFHMINPIYDSMILVTLIAIFTAVFGQIGDLVESAFKRHYGVKDSGRLLPGHGGILDRFDSMIFVFPLLHLLHLIS